VFLPVASDGLDGTVIASQGDVESNDSVASLDQVEVLLWNVSFGSSAIEEELDLLEETGLLELVELGAEVLGVDSRGNTWESSSLYSILR
jgi:hypothetical protein